MRKHHHQYRGVSPGNKLQKCHHRQSLNSHCFSQSFLSDLFEDGFPESDTLDAKLDKILQNQQVLFTLMSKLLGAVNSIGQVGVSLSVGEVSSRGLEKEVLRNQGKDCEDKDTGVERKFEPLESIGEESTITPVLSEDDLNMLGEVDGEEESEIIKIKGESCSMGNFSVRLVKRFFSASELVNRNCTGTKGKEALDPDKLGEVKKYTFRMYLTPSTQKDSQWKKCIIAIDEYLRRKKKVIPRQNYRLIK